MSDFTFDNPTDELINVISTESTALQRRLEEIYQQIETYEQTVKREETKNTDIDVALRTMRDNFDTIPRDDIRARYEEAMKTGVNLATMRGQLQQFKSTIEIIEEEQRLLKDVLKRIRGGVELSDGSEAEAAAASASSANIIRIVQTQEDERRRLANQMHDGPAQSLTNFVLQAEICQRLFDRNPDDAREELINLKEAASVTFQRVRDFIADLRPMMLDDLGILPTVRRYVESFGSKSDIEVVLDLNGRTERRLEEYQEVMLFRGVQDLMAHARDFADATQITVYVDIEQDRGVAIIKDNGRSFDTEVLLENDYPDNPRAQGILTLREKFDLVNGEISVASGEGSQTEVRIEMAISDRVAR